MTKFEIGKTYECRSACDHNCVWKYTVTARTAATITVVDEYNKVFKFRINMQTSEYRNAESVYPLGKYSMCPILTAKAI